MSGVTKSASTSTSIVFTTSRIKEKPSNTWPNTVSYGSYDHNPIQRLPIKVRNHIVSRCDCCMSAGDTSKKIRPE